MKKFILSCFILCFIVIIAGCTNIFQWKYDYLVLVNKQHKLPADWESKVELVEVKNAFDEDIKVEKEAYEQYLKLRDALLEEGVDIELDSVYRSVSRQEELWAEFEEEYGIDYTKKYVAVPWYSEHHTALAIDICIKKDWVLIYENDDMIAEKEIFDKIHAKLADYGFILRYLEWKEDITWYGYEPRHLRYVGDVKVAKEIMDKWLTLEEYLGEEKIDTILPEDEPEINNEVELVEEPELSEIETLKQSFVWNIIDWTVDKDLLTLKPSNIPFDVEWDNTLYYLDEFWIALVLWEDWKWWKVENAYEWKYLASVRLKKSWNKTYWFFLIDNEYYHTRQENPQPDEELVWENNKYHIVMRTVKNWGKDWSFDLVVYDVE